VALLAAQLAWRDPRFSVLCAGVVAVSLLPPYLARRRMRRLLMSGDVEGVLGTWRPTLDRITHPETMIPLMAATAYAAYGWIEAARRALERAGRGPAWEAALEQRLFVEALLDTFEGDVPRAQAKARALLELPMPSVGLLARRRIGRLRRGVSALVRAFHHQSDAGDGQLLAAAARVSPLVHWAMRYAGAVVAIDHGRAGRARALLEGAPPWPAESAFRSFHEEIAGELTSRGAA
jgi:hypothetical protein